MKKIMLTLVLLMSVICGATAQNDVMYVYRNDGHINTIFKDELDSMVCSQIDLDSVFHKEYVVQEFHTTDSIYRIPLNVIDSIGFVTPETKFKSGVVQLDDFRDYIISVDHMTIHLKKDIPTYLIPQVGAKLVTTEISDLFVAGFAGEVESVQTLDDKISVICEKSSLEDIFECFYFTTKITENNSKVRRAPDNIHTWGGKPYSPGTVTLTDNHIMSPMIKPDINGDLSFQVGYNHQVSLTPTYCGKASLIVSPTMGTVFSVELTEERKLDDDYSLSGAIDYTNDVIHKEIPFLELGIPFLWAYADVGIFVRAEATAALQLHFGQTYRTRLMIDLSSRNFFLPTYRYTNIEVGNEYSGSFMVNGSVGVGVFGELGIEFVDKRIASAAFRGEAGFRLQGDAVLYKKDAETALHSTQLYRNLKDSKVSIIPFYKVGAQAQLLNFGWDNGGFKPLTRDFEPLLEASLVPTFAKTKLESDEENPTCLFASSEVSGYTLPQDLGFTLIEGTEDKGFSDEGRTSYATSDYVGPKIALYSTYFDTKSSEGYRVYPTVKLMNIEMLAEPYADLSTHSCPDSNHPHAIDLGLPSGTKWCCMNVGASSPEQPGGYYAWGETSEKSVYNAVTYKYCTGEDSDGDGWYERNRSYQNIGSDIAGTSYDVAHVRMGAPWRMPSHAQQMELINNCTRTWTQQNGVNGILMTGKNGGQLFLPAAGWRNDSDLNDAGSDGSYWSSSLNSGSDDYVSYYLGFLPGNWYWDYHGRYHGISVRAVCP